MRTKYNDQYERFVHGYRSNIEKYLSDELEFLLASSSLQYRSCDFEKTYISNPEVEDFLTPLLKPIKTDRVRYLTGLTGSGKSTILRHIFFKDGESVSIQGSNLIICFSFDNITDSYIRDYFANTIHGVAEMIEESFCISKVNDAAEDFYKYVRKTRLDFSQSGPKFPVPSNEAKLSFYASEHPLPFSTSRLKFYLNQEECLIDNIILIVDDLEGLIIGEDEDADAASELLPVKLLLELITCLENNRSPRKWDVNAVISCRHYVYRLMSSTYITDETTYTKALMSYSGGQSCDLYNPPNIHDILEKRFRNLKPADDKKWELAYNISMFILFDIESKLGDLIMALRLNNIRDSLLGLKQLLYNKYWIQRDYPEPVSGAFRIDDVKQYNVNIPTLIRALGMGESTVYASYDSCLPNLLANEYEEMSDLFTILTLKHFIVACNGKKMKWSSSFSIKKFLEITGEIFDTKENSFYHDGFQVAVTNLIHHRLLLRSMDQIQNDTKGLTLEKAKAVESIYVSDSAVLLWNYMSDNSVLFEMFIDDIWMDNSGRKEKRMFRGFDEDNFKACIEYLDHLIDLESVLYSHAKNLGKGRLYLDCFGRDPVCSWLIKGLRKSLFNFYHDCRSESEHYVSYCETRLDRLDKKIQSILG